MATLNKVMLIGNLTRDPELKYTPSGTAVATFGIAVNRVYTSKDGEKKQETDFFDVEVWNKAAENANEYLAKGRSVFVEGRLKQDRWEDDNGNRRTKIKVVAINLQYLSGRSSDSDQGSGGGRGSEGPGPGLDEGNLPF